MPKRVSWVLIVSIVLSYNICAHAQSSDCVEKQISSLDLLSQSVEMVHGSVNGRPALLAVDTGATHTSLAPNAEIEYGLSLRQPAPPQLIPQNYSGPRYLIRVSRFDVGPFHANNVDLPVLPVSYAPSDFPVPVGLVGEDILRRYDFEFDYEAHQLRFFAPTPCAKLQPDWGGTAQSVPLQITASGLPSAAINLNGHVLRAIIDTGANYSVISSTSAKKTILKDSDVIQNGSSQFNTPYKQGMEGIYYKLPVISFGLTQVPDFSILVANEDFIDADMLLGMDFLRGHRILISMSRRIAIFR